MHSNRLAPRRALAAVVFLLAAVLAAPTPARAKGDKAPLMDAGALPHFTVEHGKKVLALPLDHTDVVAKVTGFVARVTVTQTYQNPYERPIEAVYVFPLPDRAAVDDLKMVIGDRVIQGQVKAREDAKRTYEAAKRAGHTAALLEQERPNVFTQKVANIAPGSKIRVVIRYVERLAYDAGAFELAFPMVVGPRYDPGRPLDRAQSGSGTHPDTTAVPDASRISPPIVPKGMRSGHDISLKVLVDAGMPIRDFECPTHDVDVRSDGDDRLTVTLRPEDHIPNRDFILRWWVDGKKAQATVLATRGDAGGFFTLVLQPPKVNVDRLVGNREIIFVVDVSGSMTGLPLWLCQEAMRDALARLRPDDTFNVISFSGWSAQAFEKPRRASGVNVQAALDFVNRMQAGGGTEMLNAIKAALGQRPEGHRNRYVFFLSDGYVGNERQIIHATHRYVASYDHHGARARVFGYGVGSSPNRFLFDGISREGHGLSVFASNREDPARGVEKFFRIIDHPILEDVRVDFGTLAVAKASVFPAGKQDLFASHPLVLVGRYRHGGEGRIVLHARLPSGRRISWPVKVDLPKKEPAHAVLGTLWARAKVRERLASLWDPTADRDEVKKEVTRLGIDFRIMTPYTSFVAVDESRTVGDGAPRRVVQPVEAPEDVDVAAAGGVRADTVQTAYGQGGLGGDMNGALGGLVGGAVGGNYGAAAGGGKSGSLGVHGTGTGGGGYGVGARGVGAYGAGPAMASGHVAVRRAKASAKIVAGVTTRGTGGGYGRVDIGGRGRSAPRVLAGDTGVLGSLDKNVIRRVVRRHLNEIKACYERVLKSTPNLSGKLSVHWRVDATGRVTKVSIAHDTLKNSAVATCILTHVKRWRFPKPGGGSAIEITYPFVFQVAPSPGQAPKKAVKRHRR